MSPLTAGSYGSWRIYHVSVLASMVCSKYFQISAELWTVLAFYHSTVSHLLRQLHILCSVSSQEFWAYATVSEIFFKKSSGVSQVLLSNMKNPGSFSFPSCIFLLSVTTAILSRPEDDQQRWINTSRYFQHKGFSRKGALL